MAVRIYCDMPEFSDTWVDVSERWTRRESKELVAAEGDEWLDIFHRKVEACHIETEGDDPITDPKSINEDALDDVDMRIYGYLGTVLLEAVGHLRSLGFTTGRVYSNGNAKQAATEKA